MAHLREIPTHRCRCGKKAVVELYNARNAPCGFYCRPCGKRAEKEQNRSENNRVTK